MAEAKTDIEQSERVAAGHGYEILDSDIERQRKLIGIWEPMRTAEYVQTASHDSIRNWAYGCGDEQPAVQRPELRQRTRWGGVMAPGMMVRADQQGNGGRPLVRRGQGAQRACSRAFTCLFSGSDWTFYRPVRPGDTIYSYGGDQTCEVKQSEFAGRSVISTSRRVKVNQRAEVVATYDILRVLTERKTAVKKGKYYERSSQPPIPTRNGRQWRTSARQAERRPGAAKNAGSKTLRRAIRLECRPRAIRN
jgi:acyl dehydratase